MSARASAGRRRPVGAVLALLLLPTIAAAPQEPDDPSLSAIREEVSRLRRDLARFDDRRAGIIGTLERLSMERLLLEEELRALDLGRARAERQVDASRERSRRLAQRLEEQRVNLGAALREAYKMGRLRQYRLALQVSDPQEFGRAYRYISAWSRADAQRIESFRRTAAALEKEQQRLAERLTELARNREAREARRSGLERNRAERDVELRRVEEEREVGLQAFKELEEAAGRLESLVASMREGARPFIDGRVVDLVALRGHLPWPVAGPVTVPFGTVEHPRFRTLTPHPGIDLGVPEGTPVHPIFGGRVVYADWFRGYGNTVIVDHGGDIVSIYAHLRTVEVAVGEEVAPNVSLGPSGSTGSLRGPGLYLEIRRAGEPQDPRAWLRPTP